VFEIPKYRVAHSTKWLTFEWVMGTPLGVPVEPEVKRMWAMSSGFLPEGNGLSENVSASGSAKLVWNRSPSRCVCSSDPRGIESLRPASVKSPSRSVRADASTSRSFGSAAVSTLATRAAGVATSTGTYEQSALRTACMATMAAGLFEVSRQMRSPGSQWASLISLARRLLRLSSSP
jgi:hypothetical protein